MSATAVRNNRRRPAAGKAAPAAADRSWVHRAWARKGVKILLAVAAVLILIPVLFVLGIVLGVNPIVKFGVEKLGSSALQVPVHLDRASISFGGRAHLGRLSVDNPPDFAHAEACTFQELYADVPLRSVFGDEIDIQELTIRNLEFDFELAGKDKPSNWAVLMKNLANSLPKKAVEATPVKEKTFKIQKLKLIAPVARFRASWMEEPLTLNLNDIELKDIGTAPGSRSRAYMIFAGLFQALLTGSIKEGKNLPSDVSGPLGIELTEATKAFQEVLKTRK